MIQLLDIDQDSDQDFDPIPTPNIDHLVLEDDTPVDNLQSEKQQRLLVEPLYSSRALPAPFLAAANVGLFYKLKGDPVVPDVLLSLGVQCADDFSQKQNRAYFTWEFGKLPEVSIEIVSNQEGDELTLSRRSQRKGKATVKKSLYAQIHIPYYVVFDPLKYLQGENEMNGALLRVWGISTEGYTELTPTQGISEAGQSVWLNAVGIGLTLWEGQFEEEVTRLWLRWCDQSGKVIPTGAEGQAAERERANAAEERANAEKERADASEAKSRLLADRLRAMGIDPEEV